MFGSSPFGQTSTPFGSQPTFGQNANAGNNPFAPKPFGATSPFGAQSGGSFFGNTSTGVFGNQNSSPVGSTSVFGASSTPAFGTPTPAFGSSSPSPTFGSTSAFGQKPAFGTAPTTSFGGGSFQQTQAAFGSNLFNAGSQSAFGTPSTPTFGSSNNPAFGASTSAPAFGSTTSPTFGTTASAFGATSSPMFGSTTTAFGAPTPAFGAASSSGFGAASSTAFGTTNTNAFGSSSTPAFSFSSSPSFGQSASPFGAQSSPAFGQSTSPFGGQSSPAFGQSTTSPFGAQSSPAFGQSTSPFGAQSSPFGAQTTTPSFGNTAFGAGSQQGGSRVVPYAPTPEMDGNNQPAGKLESISAMQAYKEKSHEELRWEDYQRGDKGGPAPTAQTNPGLTGFGPSTPAFGQSSSNPFSTTTPASPFATQNQAFSGSGFSVSSTPAFNSSPFASSTTTNPFGSTPSQTPTLFNSTPSFGPTNPSSQFGQSTSLFGTSAQGTSGFSNSTFGNTQPSPLFQSTTPTLGQTSSIFGQTPSSTFGQTPSSTFGQTSSTLGQSATGFGFNTPSTGFGGSMFSSTPSLGFGQTPTMSMPFPSMQAPQSAGSFGFGNFGQTASAASTGFGGGSSLFAQNTFSQPSTLQTSVVSQPAPANPYGTLPVLPQMSFGRAGNSPSIQYGISSLPVVDKPAPVRISSILTSRHISQRRIRMPVRRYHPQPDGHRVPFFNDDEETPNTPKADALFIPRENPRALVIRPVEQQRSQMSIGKTLPSKLIPGATQENGRSPEAVSAPSINGFSITDKDKEENGFDEQTQAVKQAQKFNGTPESYSITLTGHRAGEAAIAYEHGPEIEALMPKLRNSDYYTEPRIQELAAKERIENGYCQRVKNFVIGRHGYGSIKFIGETDVRGLDLESLVQFNNREVIVYMDESKKPPVGQGLNKRAEVTLLNIKCSDKKTGQQYTAGPRIEKYKEMLKRKAEDQGAEFVSYDPVKGEWKFRVEHFSRYSLREEDDD